jgi:hypothetical protein
MAIVRVSSETPAWNNLAIKASTISSELPTGTPRSKLNPSLCQAARSIRLKRRSMVPGLAQNSETSA